MQNKCVFMTKMDATLNLLGVVVVVVVAFPIFLGLRVGPSFVFLTALICCSQPNSDFGGQCVSACYLPVSGPLDFRLVIQVL